MKKLSQKQLLKFLAHCIHTGVYDDFFDYFEGVIEKAIYKVCCRKNMSISKQDAEDLRQEVYIELCKNDYKRLKDYSEEKGMTVTGWIIFITGNTVWDKLQRKDPFDIKLKQHLMSYEKLMNIIHIKKTDDVLDARQELVDLQEIMKKLTSIESIVIQLHYFENFSLATIAKRIKKNIANVYTIKFRAISKLKKHFKK
jgi:RNA polymerase sigma factor (sigma-70 family)